MTSPKTTWKIWKSWRNTSTTSSTVTLETNPSIINEIPQSPIANNLNFALTIKEVKLALKKLRTTKLWGSLAALGISGITMDMLKNLPKESYTILTSFIQQFWDDNNCNFDQWHKSKLALLYKGKGNHHDPNNWREICLKKIWAKVLSTIIAKRLLSDFKKINPKVNQFGHIALCSALMLRWQHGLQTFDLFVDLIKEFISEPTPSFSKYLLNMEYQNDDKNNRKIVPKLFCTIETRRSDMWDRIQYRHATGGQNGTNTLPLYHAGSHQNPQIQTYLHQSRLQIFPNTKERSKITLW